MSAMRKHSYVHTEDQVSVLSHQMWLLNVIVKLSSSEDCELFIHSGSVSLMVYVKVYSTIPWLFCHAFLQ